MHTPETHQKFIERLVQGWPYVRISTELGVAKSTLIEWSRKFRFEINNQRALAADELRNRVLGPPQARVNVLSERMAKVEDELRKRDLTSLSTARLYSLADSLRRQIEGVIGDPHFITPVSQIPNEEYVEQVQEWKP